MCRDSILGLNLTGQAALMYEDMMSPSFRLAKNYYIIDNFHCENVILSKPITPVALGNKMKRPIEQSQYMIFDMQMITT